MKDKIAICISGQTREINKLGILELLEEVLELFDEFDYDLYGHTWHDHDDPKKEFLDRFTEYQSENQEVIWKDIINLMYSEEKEEPKYQQFFQIDDQWRNKEEFMDMLHGKSDKNYLEFCKERIKGTVGQVWSAHRSFQLMNQYPRNKYYLVVRLRWDLMIKNYFQGDYMDKQKQRFKDMLHYYRNNKYDFENTHRKPSVLCADDCTFELRMDPYANDHVYVFDGDDFLRSKILTTTPIQYLVDIIDHYSIGMTMYHLPSAHTLWMQWLLHGGLTVSPKLPDIFQASGTSKGKINKEWNI